MQLAPMRFTKIEGTTVGVHVTSAAEAKLALKELRHKKKELKFLRGALAKQVKASKPKRGKARPAPKSGLETFFDDMRWGIASMLTAKPEPSEAKPRKPTPAEIEQELRDLDQILHNLEGCILQIQGKLLTRG